MERLTIDEVIEHCNKTCDMTERIAKARGHELESIESKQFWEHYQVREWLQELQEYKKLEEQGLLLRLPCKVGDTVYIVMRLHYQPNGLDMSQYKEIEEVEVDNITIGKPYWQINYDEHEFLPKDFGKSVFLTREEAEQALKQIGEEYGKV